MRRNAVLALVAVVALLAASCVRDRDPEPGVRAITTDLQYKQLREKSAAPPNTIPAEQPTTKLDRDEIPKPTFKPFDEAPIGPVAPSRQVCPTAAPTEQADEDVTTNLVKGKPSRGEYLWKVDGSEKYDETTRLALPTYVKKEITDLKVEEGIISYVAVEKELSALNPNAPTVRSSFTVDPEAGVTVTKVERRTPDGDTSAFEPLDPINYLVLPVKFGSENAWTSQSVDALSGEPQILDHKAYVKGRITIDACGERIRGWHVIAEQEYRKGPSSIKRHFEYAVATQLGGIVIYEDVRSPCTWNAAKKKCAEGDESPPSGYPEGVADLEFKSNIGQTKPS